MIQYLAAMLAIAAWNPPFEETPPMSSSMAGTIHLAESNFADGAGANVAIHRVRIASNSFNVAVPYEAISPVSIEATIEPKWQGWTGFCLICQDGQYQGQARMTDGRAFLRLGLSGTIQPTNTGLWLVTYHVEMQLGDGSQIKRLAAAGSAVLEEGKRVNIVTIGGLSVFLQVSRTEANSGQPPPLEPGWDSGGPRRASQGFL